MSAPTSWGRSTMIHRCVIVRDFGVEEAMPGYGPEPLWDIHMSDIPCLLWADFRSGYSGEQIGVSADSVRTLWRMLMPLSMRDNIREGDIIENVKDKRDEIYHPHPMRVTVALRRSIYTYLFLEETR